MGFLSDVKTDQRPGPEDNVAQVRSRARRRLIGAAALLAVGVIGFPLLFETKPRPVAADVPVVQSSRDRSATPGQTKVVERPAVTAATATPTTSATAAQPAAPGTASPPMITERAQDAGREIPIPAPAVDPARVAQEKAERERVEKERLDKERLERERAAKDKADKDKADKDKADKDKADKDQADKDKAERLAAEKARDDKAKADKERQEKERATQAKADRDRQVREQQAKADGERRARTAAQAKVAPAARPAASDRGRFAVQVGAYASASSVRDVRNRLERVGLRSYTQVVKVGTRVRTGPYDSRQEAEKAADKARSIGLAPSIVPLSP